jgi:hypothetical protein
MPEPESSSSKRSGKLYTELDLITGELAFLGPRGLDVLKICPSCRLDPGPSWFSISPIGVSSHRHNGATSHIMDIHIK